MWLVGIVICAGWIFSLCLHEFSHALVAYWGGDTSVKDKGYLTFNPLKYTDPGYSIALPLLFLLMGGIGLPGGAVYIDIHRLRNRWWQTAVSAAGPIANIAIALLLGIFFQLVNGSNLELRDPMNESSFIPCGVAFLIYLQVFAAIFNLLPIPGLDGYGIIEPWLPQQIRDRFNYFRKYSTLIIIGLFWYAPWFSNSTFKVVSLITDRFLQIPDAFIGMGSSLFRQPINQGITLIILLTFGWSLNSHQQRPILKRRTSAQKKAPVNDRVRSQARKHGSSKSWTYKKPDPIHDRMQPEAHQRGTSNSKTSVREKVIPIDRVSPKTRKRAIMLAGNDMKRIERLLNSARRKHPDRAEQWYWEKVLYDMERDRR